MTRAHRWHPLIGAGLLLIAVMTVTAGAAALRCTRCSKAITGRYVVGPGNTPYCARACFETTLPQCEKCGRRIEGAYMQSGTNAYCSEACFETSLPLCEVCGVRLRQAMTWDGHLLCSACTQLPRCFQCQWPLRSPATLPDGRPICATCRRTGIFTQADAQALYEDAHRQLIACTGLRVRTFPSLVLADQPAIRAASPSTSGTNVLALRGTYRNDKLITDTRNLFGRVLQSSTNTTETVYLLNGLNRENMLLSAVHELTHDVVADRFPGLTQAPLWAQEGLSQYASAAVARRNGWTRALRDIEQNEDPVYGAGYRWYARTFGSNQWDAVRAWLIRGNFSALPQQP